MEKNIILFIFLVVSQVIFGNHLPYFVTDPLDYVTEFEPYSYQLIATDPDNADTLFFIVIEKPIWLNITDLKNDTIILHGSVDKFYEENKVSIAVTDKKDTVYQSFDIQILCINTAPEIISTPDTFVTIDSIYEYHICGTDLLENVLFKAISIPGWLELTNTSSNNAILSGIPDLLDTGTYEIMILAYREYEICQSRDIQFFNLTVLYDSATVKQKNVRGFEKTDKCKIWPNPCRGFLFLHTQNNYCGNLEIMIFDTKGRLLKRKHLIDPKSMEILDLCDFANGIYLICLQYKDETVYKSIVLEK